MASIELEKVPKPVDLRDLVLSEWSAYRRARSDHPPESLRATSWDDGENSSPSHASGRAIDIVTNDWSDRGYLFEFGTWLGTKYAGQDLNVIFYPRTRQPHLHVAMYSGRVGKPEASIGFSLENGQYKYFFPSEYKENSQEIASYIKSFLDTYTDSTAEVDMDFIMKMLVGGSFGFGWLLGYLKKRWWVLLIPVFIVVPLLIWWKLRRE